MYVFTCNIRHVHFIVEYAHSEWYHIKRVLYFFVYKLLYDTPARGYSTFFRSVPHPCPLEKENGHVKLSSQKRIGIYVHPREWEISFLIPKVERDHVSWTWTVDFRISVLTFGPGLFIIIIQTIFYESDDVYSAFLLCPSTSCAVCRSQYTIPDVFGI